MTVDVGHQAKWSKKLSNHSNSLVDHSKAELMCDIKNIAMIIFRPAKTTKRARLARFVKAIYC